MRKLIRGLRARVERRTRAWLRRRQGPDRDPVELHYAAMVFAMVIGGLNYNNNLGLGLAFLLVSLGLVAMHHCHGTLSGLALRLHATRSAFAGEEVRFGLLLENHSRAPRPRIEVGLDGSPAGIVDVPPVGSVPAEIAVQAQRRGRVLLARFVLATRHPLGLFRAWAVVHPEYAAIAWPRPADRSLPPPAVETDTGGAQDGARGEEDFAGLKPYQAGDSLRRIAWKAYARGQGLHTKQYAGTDVVSHVFDWDSLEGLDVEARLAQLCRWVVDAHEHGEAFGLRLPGLAIDPNIGTAHLEHCLNALALYEPGAARG
jgi:uncharacterized protein (DUF58 family)